MVTEHHSTQFAGFRQGTTPTDADHPNGTVAVGDVWSDTAALLWKRCSSIGPITFVSTEGGSSAHDLFSATHGDVDEADTPTNGQILKFNTGAGLWRAENEAAASGEANTGSNQGTDGVGVFRQKTAVDLEFRHVAPASSKITTTLNGQDIDIDVVEANLSLANLGTRNHASLSDAPASAHHAKYLDSEAIAAVEGEAALDLAGILSFVTPSTLTVATGDITPTKSAHLVAGESGAADNLDGIVAANDGALLLLGPLSGSVNITVRHNQNAAATKNILLSDGASFLMDTIAMWIMLVYRDDVDTNGAWVELARSSSAAKTETLTNKTLTTPTIGDQTNAGHNHSNAAGGGGILESALTLSNIGGSVTDGQIPAAIARDSELHAAVTLSGTPDYITLSGQDIVRGLIVLTTDVSGLLPAANIDAAIARDTELHTEDHAARHADGGADELAVQDLASDAATDGQVAKADGAGAVAFEDDQVVINFIIDGGGSVITTGVKGFVKMPFAVAVTGWNILADQSGSIVVDVWAEDEALSPPTVADTIAGTEKPTLASAQKNEDLALTSWTNIAAGDWVGFNVDSITTVQRVTVAIRGRKT